MTLNRRRFLALAAAGAAMPAWPKTIAKYEYGVVGPARQFADSVKYGFDFHEAPIYEIAHMPDDDFARFRDQVLASPIRCKRMNFFTSYLDKLPAIYVVGSSVSNDELTEYCNKALSRAKQLGCECACWGSAKSRDVPDGFSRDKAWEQIRDFLRLADPIAKANGIVIGIEPIRPENTNILMTGAEVLKMVHDVDRPNIKMILDYFHMSWAHESPDIILTAGKDIVHFHFARPNPKVWPTLQDPEPGYAPFFANIKKIGYTGGIAIEAKGTYEHDSAAALEFFHHELS